MNIYFLGMCVSFALYLLISVIVSKSVKEAEDYYVAGRRAPVLLIAGSLIASYTGIGMFMGDPAECYNGIFAVIMLLATMQTAGYVLGAVFFGRYLRRSGVLTVPAFFEKRFCSRPLRLLSSVTAIIMMSVYLLSVMQGIGTLMHAVTGYDYNLCITIALIVFTLITVLSGSRGVLITDTVMSLVFLLATVLAVFFVAHALGGWFPAVKALVSDPATSDLLSWHGRSGVLYETGWENIAWGFLYGIVWMAVCMVGPWQSSRYLMARDEHVVVRSAYPAVIAVFVLEFLTGMMAVFVRLITPDLDDPSHVLIHTAMTFLPGLLGVLLLTGVLAAGISSATTFLSLIGSSVANDLLHGKTAHPVRTGRIATVTVALIILLLALYNPPSIFWVMYMGSSIVAASWLPVVIGCIASKRLTKTGAFCGMAAGFLVCFLLRLFTGVTGANLPVYFEPSLVGIVINALVMIFVSMAGQVTKEEQDARKALFVTPEENRAPEEIKKTLFAAKLSVLSAVVICAVLFVFWALPYLIWHV